MAYMNSIGARLRVRGRGSSGLFDLHGADLVFRDLGDGVVGRIGEQVGAALGKVEGHEHHALVHPRGQARLRGDLAAAGDDPHLVTLPNGEATGIFRVYLQVALGHLGVEGRGSIDSAGGL